MPSHRGNPGPPVTQEHWEMLNEMRGTIGPIEDTMWTCTYRLKTGGKRFHSSFTMVDAIEHAYADFSGKPRRNAEHAE